MQQSCPWVQCLQPNPAQPTKLLSQPIARKTLLIYHSQWKVIRHYRYLSLLGYEVLLQQSQKAYQPQSINELKSLDPTPPSPTYGKLWEARSVITKNTKTARIAPTFAKANLGRLRSPLYRVRIWTPFTDSGWLPQFNGDSFLVQR